MVRVHNDVSVRCTMAGVICHMLAVLYKAQSRPQQMMDICSDDCCFVTTQHRCMLAFGPTCMVSMSGRLALVQPLHLCRQLLMTGVKYSRVRRGMQRLLSKQIIVWPL